MTCPSSEITVASSLIISDTFEHIIKTQANINLLAKNYLGDYIFSSDDRGIEVLIYKEKECIFNGYIQPQTYN